MLLGPRPAQGRFYCHFLLGLLLAGQIGQNVVLAQTWCGKNYMRNQSVVPPGGQFPIPPVSITPLLAFRCTQAIRPFLPADSSSEAAILIDAHVTSMELQGSQPFIPPPDGNGRTDLSVTVSFGGQVLTSGSVPLGSTRYELPLLLSKLQPRREAYTLECSASLQDGQTFNATGKLTYLPEPSTVQIASASKMDLRTGAILAKGPNGEGEFEPVFPIGFYTQFDNYLTNLTVLSELKYQGFNVVHPIPPFSNLTALDAVLDQMESLGLYLMYDMRWTYMNDSRVTEEVNRIKTRRNLLLWYTADEPDGTSDPLNATVRSYHLINSLDGGDSTGGAGYHPISLVLNCQDYEFSAYANGTDIIMQDVYHIGNNVTFSSEWGTECTPDYGDCGCDNCKGSYGDISSRLDEFNERMLINGWERTKAIWTVPQGFGNSSYWKRYPTGREFIVQSILAINHGARGVISWMDPTTPEIKASASDLALSLPRIAPYILNPKSIFYRIPTDNGVDISTWTLNNSTLLLAANLNTDKEEEVYVNATEFVTAVENAAQTSLPFERYFSVGVLFELNSGGSFSWVAYDGASQMTEAIIRLEASGSGAFIFDSNSSSPAVSPPRITNDALSASPFTIVLKAVLFSIITSFSISLAS